MMRILALLGALAAAWPAVRLTVGQTAELPLGFRPIQIICDDVKVVLVQVHDGAVALRGLAPGRTACSFTNVAFQRDLVDIEVYSETK